jgi:hypothetical protein
MLRELQLSDETDILGKLLGTGSSIKLLSGSTNSAGSGIVKGL